MVRDQLQRTRKIYSMLVADEAFYFLQIWELADSQKNGYLTRDGLYKAFALIALAQQGKTISEKSLEMLIDSGISFTSF